MKFSESSFMHVVSFILAGASLVALIKFLIIANSKPAVPNTFHELIMWGVITIYLELISSKLVLISTGKKKALQ